MIDTISVVIIAKDADVTIEETLESVIPFKNVVLYLNNSSDNTEEIAKKYLNVNIVNGDFLGFGPTKNKAASYAPTDWILSLDSDEVIFEALLEELKALKLENKKEVFILKRDNYFFGQRSKI
ncbi:MAG: glycosyltransferase [Sulfurovum sp.]|nr:glycosyltransferase [Sulfurovum sp.]